MRGVLCVRSVCLRAAARGLWSAQMRYWRFVNNARVTVDKLIEGWSQQTRIAACGRHVLAIQDTSDIKFATTPEDRRGLGKVGKGNVFGVLLHAMMAVDADSGLCLGLAGGKLWTRAGDVKIPHGERPLAERESARWLTTAAQASEVLAQARMITVINDREGDIYAHWARTPQDNVHLLSRVMHDHALVQGGTLRQAVKRMPSCAKAVLDLPKRMDRAARKAHLCMRFGTVGRSWSSLWLGRNSLVTCLRRLTCWGSRRRARPWRWWLCWDWRPYGLGDVWRAKRSRKRCRVMSQLAANLS